MCSSQGSLGAAAEGVGAAGSTARTMSASLRAGAGMQHPLAPLAPLAPIAPLAAWPPDYVLERGWTSAQHPGASCPYPPSVLDFLPLRGVDADTVEENWPCEVRAYWVRDLHPFVTFVRFIYAYFTLFVVATGMLLNLFAFRVWSSKAMRGTSLAVYLRALSLSDMGALVFTYFLGYWRSHHPAFNTLFLNNEAVCRFHKILVSMFPMTSQWIQTALTVERLLVVWRPLRSRNPAYPQVAVRAARRTVALVYITLILVALTKWHFSGFEQYSAFDYQRCEHNNHSSVVAVYVYVALSTYLPGTIIFVSNVILFLKLRRSDSLRRSLFAGTSHDGACYSSDTAARTLVLFSLLYLLLQLPLGIVETVELYWDVSLYRPPSSSGAKREAYIYWLNRKLQLKWARSFLFWLFQLSFVLNFVVYLKSGGRFRAVAKAMAWEWVGRVSCGLGRQLAAGPGPSLRRGHRPLSSLPLSLRSASCSGAAVPVAVPYPAHGRVSTTFVPSVYEPALTLHTVEEGEEGAAAAAGACQPASTNSSTSSFSSSSSASDLLTAGSANALSLCWQRSRHSPRFSPRTSPRVSPRASPCRTGRRASPRASPRDSPWASPAPRQRARTIPCPHRASSGQRKSAGYWTQRAASGEPCKPCRRARINTWATVVKTQGVLALARGVVGGSMACRAGRESTPSSGHSPLTRDGDLDSDSVFDSPPAFALTVMHHEEELAALQEPCGGYVGPAGDCGSQDDLLSLPLQDPAEAYASPALLAPPAPAAFHSQQDLLSLPLPGPAASALPQDLLCLQDASASPNLQAQQEVLGPWPYPAAGAARALDRRKGDDLFLSDRRLDRHEVCVATSRTNRRLERYLSEPHAPAPPR
ncbi:Neuromedin-U receptor 1 [Frankliniella fusca]|uniref:Neuromedin-U receptor 1 n=1 Tax=Frankliniella fusca TaxID=407009 RepID=A0AAE1LPE4_9NEOP|nr:Neuromedin-U receptor 1 [Frankliniella fusca]